jgi:hypothetical protein
MHSPILHKISVCGQLMLFFSCMAYMKKTAMFTYLFFNIDHVSFNKLDLL